MGDDTTVFLHSLFSKFVFILMFQFQVNRLQRGHQHFGESFSMADVFSIDSQHDRIDALGFRTASVSRNSVNINLRSRLKCCCKDRLVSLTRFSTCNDGVIQLPFRWVR